MGFNTGSSNSNSQSSSEARQAVFFPSDQSIQDSMGTLTQYGDLAQKYLDPYVSTASDALNQMRMLTGMKPVDPLEGITNRLGNSLSELSFGGGAKIPLEYLLNSNNNTNMFNSNLFSPQHPEIDSSANLSFLNKGVEGTLQKRQVDEYMKKLNDAAGQGDSTAKAALPVFESFNDVLSNLSNIMGSNDPTKRTEYFKTTVEGFDQLISSLDSVGQMAGSSDIATKEDYQTPSGILGVKAPELKYKDLFVTTGSGNSSASDIAKVKTTISLIKADFMKDFSPDAPRALTNEEIAQKVQMDPGYQFRYNQGLQAVERSASAKGLTQSGRLMKELQTYGEGLASQQYQQTLQNYAQMAGIGLPATQQSSSQTVGLGSQLASAVQDMGREWNMSPWTQRSQSSSNSSSSSFGISL